MRKLLNRYTALTLGILLLSAIIYWINASLKKGADPNIKDQNGNTALHFAAAPGNVERVRLLLEKKANPNIRNHYGKTALHEAAFRGCREIVELLLEKGADPNIGDFLQETALHVAATFDYPKTVGLLLEKGADPNIRNTFGTACLFMAIQYDVKPEIISALRKKEAFLNANDIVLLIKHNLKIPDNILTEEEKQLYESYKEKAYKCNITYEELLAKAVTKHIPSIEVLHRYACDHNNGTQVFYLLVCLKIVGKTTGPKIPKTLLHTYIIPYFLQLIYEEKKRILLEYAKPEAIEGAFTKALEEFMKESRKY